MATELQKQERGCLNPTTLMRYTPALRKTGLDSSYERHPSRLFICIHPIGVEPDNELKVYAFTE